MENESKNENSCPFMKNQEESASFLNKQKQTQ